MGRSESQRKGCVRWRENKRGWNQKGMEKQVGENRDFYFVTRYFTDRQTVTYDLQRSFGTKKTARKGGERVLILLNFMLIRLSFSFHLDKYCIENFKEKKIIVHLKK